MTLTFPSRPAPVGQAQELSGSKGKCLHTVLTVVLNGNNLDCKSIMVEFHTRERKTDFNLKRRKTIIVTKKREKKQILQTRKPGSQAVREACQEFFHGKTHS